MYVVAPEEWDLEVLGFEELGLAVASLYSVSHFTGGCQTKDVQSIAEWRDSTESRAGKAGARGWILSLLEKHIVCCATLE